VSYFADIFEKKNSIPTEPSSRQRMEYAYINDPDAIVTAAYECHAELLERFLSQGISPDTKNEWGETALHLASQQGWSNICIILLDHDATIDMEDNGGNSPLDIANFYEQMGVSELLIARGAKQREGKSPRELMEDQITEDLASANAIKLLSQNYLNHKEKE
jgi:ankyrin repeat protein